jgi:hypothetical protein
MIGGGARGGRGGNEAEQEALDAATSRRDLMTNVARVSTVLSYGAVLAGCAHTVYVVSNRAREAAAAAGDE